MDREKEEMTVRSRERKRASGRKSERERCGRSEEAGLACACPSTNVKTSLCDQKDSPAPSSLSSVNVSFLPKTAPAARSERTTFPSMDVDRALVPVESTEREETPSRWDLRWWTGLEGSVGDLMGYGWCGE